VDLLLADLIKRVQENDFALELTEQARSLILEQGYDPTYGARPLKRAIQKLVEDAVSEEILKKTVQPGDRIRVDASEGKIMVGKA
jgi:ATP-dependent Clp protease ATP-binding subunit ClpC